MRTVARIATVLTGTVALLAGFAAPGAHAVRGQLYDADGALAALDGALTRPQAEPGSSRVPGEARASVIGMTAIGHRPRVPDVASLKPAGSGAADQRLAGLASVESGAKDRSIAAMTLALDPVPAARPNAREAARDQHSRPGASRDCEACTMAFDAPATRQAIATDPAATPVVIRFERVVINISFAGFGW